MLNYELSHLFHLFFSPQDRLRSRLEALSMQRDEIEDIKSWEDQKIQVLLVRPHYCPLSFWGVFLTESGESCCRLIAIAWLERTGKLFSFISGPKVWNPKTSELEVVLTLLLLLPLPPPPPLFFFFKEICIYFHTGSLFYSFNVFLSKEQKTPKA